MEGDLAVFCRPACLRLSLGCELAQVRPVVAVVHGFLAEQGWQEEDLLSLDVALAEACNNAVKYAGDPGRSRLIDVEAVCEHQQVELRVHDHTPGFDWPQKIELPAAESESGRGLYLITSLMDYAGYFRGGDGNILVLRKGGSGASGRDAAGELKARSGDANKLAESERVIEDLVEERVNRRLMRHELEIANGIQRSLLPEALPRLAGFSLAGYCRSAHAVGGDFYDVLPVGAEAHLLVVADVMGKGIPAALFAVILRSVLRASPELMDQPAALLTRVNRLLFSELSGVDMFITAQLVFLNAQKRRMITASAGHCPLAVADVREVRMFSPEGMPLGIFPDATFLDETVELPEDCRVLLYTDGVTDAMNARREPFGQERLLNWLRRRPAWPRTAEELKEDLAQALNTHQLDAGLADDQTFLIMAAG